MTDFRSEPTIGKRIKAARRARGFRTTRELADAMPGGNVTTAVLDNIESGRKAEIGIVQLLNISRALDVPASILLAPIGTPEAPLDLPNLSADFDNMTAAEFDCWLSAIPNSAYRPRRAAERTDIEVLSSLRELGTLQRELERLRIVLDVDTASGDPDLAGGVAELRERIDRVGREASRLTRVLTTSGVAASDSAADSNPPKRKRHG